MNYRLYHVVERIREMVEVTVQKRPRDVARLVTTRMTGTTRETFQILGRAVEGIAVPAAHCSRNLAHTYVRP